MNIDDFSQLSVSSQNLDHLGLVAATFKDLGLVDKIHARIPNKDPRRIVSTGHAVLAMIINGLGFTNRRLYLSPQFFQDKPVDRLIDPKVEAKHLDDHALGEALDEIAAYGTTRLFGELAFEIGIEHKLLGQTAHLDSTSISVDGEYKELGDGISAISITHGFSKDHRPDLKQVMLSLCTSGPSDFPIWMEPQSGNASDKKEFDQIIQRVQSFKSNLKACPDFRWVADSALYSKDGVLSQNQYSWITRVPETVKEARNLVEQADSQIVWSNGGTLDEAGYKIAPFSSTYGGVQQRWMLIYSQQAFVREKKTFEKNLNKKSEELEKALWHLGNQIFGCESDIQKEIKKLEKTYPLHKIDASIEPLLKNQGPGRPKENAAKVQKGFRVVATAKKDDAAIEAKLNTKGRFVLATNEMDEKALSDGEILQDYKGQQGVERGFRFLKDPWFMVDSIFLKSSKRIEALMMVMALSLMIYNVAQFRIREKLRETNSTLPNQLDKPIQNPTLRWIFQIMEGICKVTLYIKDVFLKEQVTNLSEVRTAIIRLFGCTAMKIYSVP